MGKRLEVLDLSLVDGMMSISIKKGGKLPIRVGIYASVVDAEDVRTVFGLIGGVVRTGTKDFEKELPIELLELPGVNPPEITVYSYPRFRPRGTREFGPETNFDGVPAFASVSRLPRS